VKQETQREIDATKTCAAPDSRFRAYAAPLADGRLVTDYRQACVTRAPPGENFAVKQWTVHNTDDIIRISRERQVQDTGHALGTANTELPGLMIQKCAPNGCSFYPTNARNGLGLERSEPVPSLFGTFDFAPSAATIAKDREFTSLNKTVEYGRNTPARWVNLYQ
jgi:hypothetical protein